MRKERGGKGKAWPREESENTGGGREYYLMKKGEVKGKIQPNLN